MTTVSFRMGPIYTRPHPYARCQPKNGDSDLLKNSDQYYHRFPLMRLFLKWRPPLMLSAQKRGPIFKKLRGSSSVGGAMSYLLSAAANAPSTMVA